MFLAGLCAGFSNLCMRRSIDKGGTSRGYLMLLMFFTCFVGILLNPVRTGDYTWSTPMALFGLCGGIFLAGVLTFLGKALEKGPPGLTIAMLNCSCVMPIFLLVILFGSAFGFSYTLWNAIGSILVVLGICWAGWGGGSMENRKKWLLFISLSFFFHVVYMVFIKWRALLINFPGQKGLALCLSSVDSRSQWFMPMIFLTAAIIQSFLFFKHEKRLPGKAELTYGTISSATQGLSAFFMIYATEISTPLQHAMIFPIFSVTIIVICNLWGKWFYKEAVNWKANALCIGGILIGTIDWKAVMG